MPRTIKPREQQASGLQHAIDPQAVGVEVSWSFGSGEADAVELHRADVYRAFERNGFGSCAPELTLDVDEAMRRALQLAANRPWLVTRELARPNRDTPRALGVYVRRPVTGESGDGWEPAGRVRYDAARAEVVALPPEGGHWMGDDLGLKAQAEARRLANLAERLRTAAINGDVSGALVNACGQARCLSRRPGGGGVYLVFNGPKAERLVQLLRDLEALTREHKGFASWERRFAAQVQELYARPLTVGSWGGSAEAALEGCIKRMLTDLEELVAVGAMRQGTMAKRAEEAEDAVRLAEKCEVFLAERAGELGKTLRRVAQAFHEAGLSEGDRVSEACALLNEFPDPARSAKAQQHAKEREQRLAAKAAAKQPTEAEALAALDVG